MKSFENAGLQSQQIRIAALLVAMAVAIKGGASIRGIAFPSMTPELAISTVEIGILFFAARVAFWIFQIPAGLLADRLGSRHGASVFLCLLALAFGGGYLFPDMFGQMALSYGLGLAQAMFMPVLLKTISDWFPVRLRGRLLCLVLLISGVAIAILGAAARLAVNGLGWRYLFIATALLALLCAVGSYIVLRDRSDLLPTQEQKISIDNGMPFDEKPSGIFKGFIRILASPATWGIVVASMAIGLLTESQQMWIPFRLRSDADGSGFGLYQAIMVTTIVSVCGFVGFIAGGIGSDRIFERSTPLLRRRTLVAASLAGAAVLWMCAQYAGNVVLLTVFAGIAQFLTSAAQISLWALVLSSIPSRYCGTLAAVQALATALGAATASIIVAVGSSGVFMPTPAPLMAITSMVMPVAAIAALLAAALHFRLVRKPVIGTGVQGLEEVFA